MSAVQTSRYFVLDNWTTLNSRKRWVIGEAGKATPIDWYRSQSAANYACSLLNRGVASVDPHALVGCKVVAR